MAPARVKSHLGSLLREAREFRSLSVNVLAQQAGVEPAVVHAAEEGLGLVQPYLRLAEAVAIKVDSRSLPGGATLGQRLRLLRIRQNYSPAAMASFAAVEPQVVTAVEEDADCELLGLEAIGRALGVRLTLLSINASTAFFSNAAMSSATDNWPTPPDFLKRLVRALGGDFDLDPCSPGAALSRVPARVHYTKAEDGLKQQWDGRVFMNPPYGRTTRHWVAKARDEVRCGNASLIIGLVPARVDTAWWHEEVAAHVDVWLLRGRLKFGDGRGTAPFPSALVAWGASREEVVAISEEWKDAHFAPAARRLAHTSVAALLPSGSCRMRAAA